MKTLTVAEIHQIDGARADCYCFNDYIGCNGQVGDYRNAQSLFACRQVCCDTEAGRWFYYQYRREDPRPCM